MDQDDGRDGWEEDGTDASRKPQRLQETMVSYLISLEQQVSNTEIDEEAQETLIENMLIELKSCTASAACDRRTNVIIEKICINANLTNVLELLRRFTDYAVFLARNRHSSHVLQALLARISKLLKDYHIGGAEEEQALIEAFSGFAQPILQDISWLAKDMSASHVLRAIYCVLAGIPVISEKKGKGSKHKHTVPASEPLESLQATSAKCYYISQEFTFHIPSCFHDMLRKGTETLIALPTSELQDLAADQGSAALLGVILRILMNPNIVSNGPDLGEQLIRRALNWSEDDGGEETGAPIFYGMSADKAASYFLESSIECGPIALLQTICKHAIVSRSKEYAEDFTANFVLQAVLRRLASVIDKTHEQGSEGSSSDGALRTGGKRYKKIMDICKLILDELLIHDIFHNLVHKCAGVVLWMLDLSRAMSDSEDGSYQEYAQTVSQALLNIWAGKDDKNATDDALIEVFTQQMSPKKASKENGKDDETVTEAPAKKVSIKKPKFAAAIAAAAVESNKEHDSRQLLWARLIGALLKLGKTNATNTLIKALSSVPQEVLMHMSTSGPISRAVMDKLLDNASIENLSIIMNTLETSYTSLASNFLGQHVIRRLFEKSAPTDKITMCNILQCDIKILQKTKEGRATLKLCQIDLLARKPDDWHRMIQRQARGAEMIAELTTASSGVVDAKTTSSFGINESNSHYRQEKSATDAWAVDSNSYGQEKKRKRKSAADTTATTTRGASSDYHKEKGSKYSHNNNSKYSHNKAKGADFEKIARLKGANLGLNLKDEVEKMQNERKGRNE